MAGYAKTQISRYKFHISKISAVFSTDSPTEAFTRDGKAVRYRTAAGRTNPHTLLPESIPGAHTMSAGVIVPPKTGSSAEVPGGNGVQTT